MLDGHTPRWGRLDWWLAGASVVVALVPRIVLRGHGAFDIDSALLALGVESFDFAAYHPHPPYHPLSIAAAKALAPWIGPTEALVWLSLVSLSVLAFAVFAIGHALGGRRVGAYAAVLVALSPLVTENAGVSLTYINEAAATAVVALLAIRARDRRDLASWVALGLAASIAVGTRPSAALTAGPLMLWAIGRDAQAMLRAGTAGVVGTLAWFIPALAAGGGWADFRFGNAYQTRLYVLHDPVWQGGGTAVANNLAWLAHHLRAELAWLACVGLLAFVAIVPLWRARGRHRGLLLVWGGPSLLFYGLVYGGWPLFHSGYTLGLLAPAFVAGALALRQVHAAVVQRADAPLRRAFVLLLAVVVALPLAWTPAWEDALRPRHEVEAWAASWDGLETAFPPNRTALLGGYAGHWARLDYPAYLTWVLELAVSPDGKASFQMQEVRDGRADTPYFDNVRDGPDDAPHPIPDWVEDIVLVIGHPKEGPAPGPWNNSREAVLPGGARVIVLDAHAFDTIEQAVPGFNDPFPPIPRTIWPPQ